jgi:phosphatidylserine decarboxylase
MLRFHKEGKTIIGTTVLLLLGLNGLVWWMANGSVWQWIVGVVSGLLLVAVLQFFRNPTRGIQVADDGVVYAPADGKVVVIEETTENEYFKDKRLQVSIFMSPTNVHVNRNPVGGKVNYYRYHKGKYLVAWHPKSSTENERTTVVIENEHGAVLLRQIAGFMAKRIVNYLEEGQEVTQGTDMGFIKFGSRVDIFLPLEAKVEVAMNQRVKGNKTIIARF